DAFCVSSRTDCHSYARPRADACLYRLHSRCAPGADRVKAAGNVGFPIPVFPEPLTAKDAKGCRRAVRRRESQFVAIFTVLSELCGKAFALVPREDVIFQQ